jgi:opacity protein-like surface antigen
MRLIRLPAAALAALSILAAVAHAQDTTSSTAPITPAGTLTGIEAMTSTVMQEGQSSFSGLAVRVRLQPAQLMKQIEIMPTIEYWRNSNTVQPYGIETTRKDATIGVDGRFNMEFGAWRPYLGAGYGLHFLSSKVNAPSLGLENATDSVTKGGLALLGGLSFALSGKFDNFLDLKYHHVTEYRQFKINWGIAYNL